MRLVPRQSLRFNDNPDQIEILIAPNAGACFGVVRAIQLGFQAAKRGLQSQEPVYALGPLIHNRKVVSDLADIGVETKENAQSISQGTVILRSHGIAREEEKALREKGVKIVDATCPLVKKPQRIAQSLGEKGYFLILVGDRNHPEIKGVLSYFGREQSLVTYSPDELSQIPHDIKKVGIVAQTTIELKVFEAVVEEARRQFEDVLVYNTICDATSVRQTEALELAGQADVLIVIGGKHSSNTNKLVKICKNVQPDTYHIEEIPELQPYWFHGKRRIGITGGASTPQEYVAQAGETVAAILSQQQAI